MQEELFGAVAVSFVLTDTPADSRLVVAEEALLAEQLPVLRQSVQMPLPASMSLTWTFYQGGSIKEPFGKVLQRSGAPGAAGGVC